MRVDALLDGDPYRRSRHAAVVVCLSALAARFTYQFVHSYRSAPSSMGSGSTSGRGGPPGWLETLDSLSLVPADVSLAGAAFAATLFAGLALMGRRAKPSTR